MTILDVSIVNVALPSIGRSLNFSRENLQWVITAYAIAFGGFLLLGGRAADLLGRRRVFIVGVVVFTIASLVCGLAQSEGMLIISRAVQGLGGAIISPAALSIVMTSFEEGLSATRRSASGARSAAAAPRSACSRAACSRSTWAGNGSSSSNVPVGALVLVLTPRIVPESRREGGERSYDALGAVLVSGGLALLVYTISRAPDVGWATARTILLLVASGALLVAFLVNERRVHDPLMPFHIFRVRTVTGANVVGALLGAVLFANFFLLTLYVQNVLHYSALKTGVTFVATAGTAVVAAGVAQALTTKLGPKPVIAVGLALLVGGMIWYSQIPVHGSYASDLLPGYLMVGVGIAFSFVPVSIAALAGVVEREAGTGLRPDQHLAADRRRRRRRCRVDRLHHALQVAQLGRQAAARRVDRRLRVGVLGARGLRRPCVDRGADVDQARRHVRSARRSRGRLDLRDQRFRDRVVHVEVAVEPGDLERALGLDSGRGQQKRPAVVELRPRLDQDAESGRVHEVDLREVDDDPLVRVAARRHERRADLLGVVEVELAAEADDAGGADGFDPEHRIFSQAVAGRGVSLIGQGVSSWLCERRGGVSAG